MAGGRPRQGSEAKRAPLNMKTHPELRRRLERAAEKTGRPLTQEVELRLQMSLTADDDLGGDHNHRLLQMIKAALLQVEAHTGKKWEDDVPTFHGVKSAVETILHSNRPGRKPSALLFAINKHEQTKKSVRSAIDRLQKSRGRPPVDHDAMSKPGGILLRLQTLTPRGDGDAEKHSAQWQALAEAEAAAHEAADELMKHLEPAAAAQRAAMAAGEEIGDKLLTDYRIMKR